MDGEKRYEFRVVIAGYGKDADQAWEEATEQFSLDPGPTPGEDEYTVEEAEVQK